jgi:hypothetical protein
MAGVGLDDTNMDTGNACGAMVGRGGEDIGRLPLRVGYKEQYEYLVGVRAGEHAQVHCHYRDAAASVPAHERVARGGGAAHMECKSICRSRCMRSITYVNYRGTCAHHTLGGQGPGVQQTAFVMRGDIEITECRQWYVVQVRRWCDWPSLYIGDSIPVYSPRLSSIRGVVVR